MAQLCSPGFCASVLPAASTGFFVGGKTTGEPAKPLALLALISGENQTGEQNADVAATTSRPKLRVSRREERPVNKAGYASVAENRVVEEKVQMSPNKRASVLGR